MGPTENINACVMDLKTKAKYCEFGELYDSLIRDRTVCGIREDQVCPRLLQQTNPTLNKAIDIYCANEVTSNQMKVFDEEAEVSKMLCKTVHLKILA